MTFQIVRLKEEIKENIIDYDYLLRIFNIYSELTEAREIPYATFKNIVLSGGGASYPNVTQRIIEKCANIPLLANAQFLKHPKPSFGAWKGMQISLQTNLYEKYAKTATQYFARL